MKTKKQKKIGIIALIIAIIVMLAAAYFVGRPLITYVSEPDKFRALVDNNRLLSALAYAAMNIIQVVISLIPGEPFELLAGYAFGAVDGTLLCLIAATAGSMIVFALVRKFGVRLLEIFFDEEKINSLKFLKSSPNRYFIMLVVFLIPGTPKDLLAYYAGLTDMKWWLWLIMCFFGRIPSVITSTISGDALGEQKYLAAGIVTGATLLLAGAGLIIYKRILNKHAAEGKAQDTD